MADKTRLPKKPEMTIKERRAAKRSKAAESGEIIRKRKSPNRG